jgi:hypothetical protein
MGKTYRKNPLDETYGCFDHYQRRNRRYPNLWICHTDEEGERLKAWDLAWDFKHWSKRRRDGRSGHYNYRAGGRKKKYSQMTAKFIRNETRKTIHDGMRNGDWDDLVFPTNWDGKKFIWSVW